MSMFKPAARPLGDLAPAFQLVRQLLAERPRTFQQILQDGIALRSAAAGPSTTPALGPQGIPPKASKGKSKGRIAKSKRVADEATNVVPAGHPFISASFLKKRILPVLSSQDLIVKSSKPTFATPVGTFAWSLKPPVDPALSESNPNPPPSWNTDDHWDRLIAASERPGSVAYQFNAYRAEIKSHKRLAALDNPSNRAARRTEREIWAWEGRAEGLTTTLERTHLNVRRANGRPEKERARLEMFGRKAETSVRAGSL